MEKNNKPIYKILVETAADGQFWGRIHYGADLITSCADTKPALTENIYKQLEGFYDIKRDDIVLVVENEKL